MTTSVNERSPIFITITFTDESGNPVTPTTVDWRLDDVTDNVTTQIVDWTNLPSPASTMQVTVPGSNNNIVDEDHNTEQRVFGVRVDDGLQTEGYSQKQYNVLNLVGPTGP